MTFHVEGCCWEVGSPEMSVLRLLVGPESRLGFRCTGMGPLVLPPVLTERGDSSASLIGKVFVGRGRRRQIQT